MFINVRNYQKNRVKLLNSFLFVLIYNNSIFCRCCYFYKKKLKKENEKLEKEEKKKENKLKNNDLNSGKENLKKDIEEYVRFCSNRKSYSNEFEKLENIFLKICSDLENVNNIEELYKLESKFNENKEICLKKNTYYQNLFKNYIQNDKNFISLGKFNKLANGKITEFGKYISCVSFFDQEVICENTPENIKKITKENGFKNYGFLQFMPNRIVIFPTDLAEKDYRRINECDISYSFSIFKEVVSSEGIWKGSVKLRTFIKYKTIDNDFDKKLRTFFTVNIENLNIFETEYEGKKYILFDEIVFNKLSDSVDRSKIKKINDNIFYLILDLNGDCLNDTGYNLKIIGFYNCFKIINLCPEKYLFKEKLF